MKTKSKKIFLKISSYALNNNYYKLFFEMTMPGTKYKLCMFKKEILMLGSQMAALRQTSTKNEESIFKKRSKNCEYIHGN